MKTSTVKHEAPAWHIIDAEGQKLGRIAAKAAHVLRGKHKASFSPHQLCGDHVIIVNVDKISFTDRQLLNKTYYRHSGYLGHLKSTSLRKMMEEKAVNVMELAVKGMLPKNKLRAEQLARLHVFEGAEHKHDAQQPTPLTVS